MLRRRLSEINNYHKQQRPHVAVAGAATGVGAAEAVAGGSSSGAPCQCLPQHITVGDKGCCGYAYSEQLRPLAFIKCQNGGTTGERQWHGAWCMEGECGWRVLFEHWRSCNYVFTQLIQIYVNGKSLRTNVQSALFAAFHCRVAAFNAFPQSSPHTHSQTWLLQIFNELQVQLVATAYCR